jgi:hypothetical protein
MAPERGRPRELPPLPELSWLSGTDTVITRGCSSVMAMMNAVSSTAMEGSEFITESPRRINGET